ncbi:unnamed protein product [Mytilus coruscus]|uniref:Uncharacterized protein n=1 Tax=Mytilus coruscus TaxID=42192 RepID=A0A6J8DQG7_MYTCO|nr:unnamed protein product [Mytilus coruscus]
MLNFVSFSEKQATEIRQSDKDSANARKGSERRRNRTQFLQTQKTKKMKKKQVLAETVEASSGSLSKHVRSTHSLIKYPCDVCGNEYKRTDSLYVSPEEVVSRVIQAGSTANNLHLRHVPTIVQTGRGVTIASPKKPSVPGVSAADATIAQPSEDKSSGNIELVNSFVEISDTCTWSKSATKLVISMYKNYENKVEKGLMRKKELWAVMSLEMSKHGYKFSAEQSGAGKKSYEYEEQMDEIFGKDPAVTPIVTASSTSSGNKRKIDDSADQSLQKFETKRPKCSPTSEMVSLLRQYTENQENRYNADLNRREQQFRERMATMKDLVNVLKTFKE